MVVIGGGLGLWHRQRQRRHLGSGDRWRLRWRKGHRRRPPGWLGRVEGVHASPDVHDQLRHQPAAGTGGAIRRAGLMTSTETRPDIGTEQKPAILPPWSVVLHNDDHNEMMYVVRSLVKSVPNLGATRATRIMFEAHQNGKATVTTCPLELAELYRDRLQSCGLTTTIEPA